MSWWLRIVGLLYVVDSIMMTFIRAPIEVRGPAGVLTRAGAGDATARFAVDTWSGFGLEVGAIGLGLLAASERPALALPLVWTVIAVEMLRGVAYDFLMATLGYDLTTIAIWLVIHATVIATGVLALRKAGSDPRSDVIRPRGH